MLDFENFKFLTVEKVKKVVVHQSAKFRQNCLNCGRDMVIFSIFNLRFSKFKIFKVRNGQEGRTA